MGLLEKGSLGNKKLKIELIKRKLASVKLERKLKLSTISRGTLFRKYFKK